MEKEFDKKAWTNGYVVTLLTAIWVASSVVTLAQSGLVA
jgi:hypothetical protein